MAANRFLNPPTLPPQRITMQTCFATACAGYDGWTNLNADDQSAIIRRIERSCFAATVEKCTKDGIDRLFTEIKFTSRYSAECARVLANLPGASGGSIYLVNALVNKSIDPGNCANLSSAELCPQANSAERANVALRMAQRVEIKVSRQHVCKKCLKNETVPVAYQGRSSDEVNTHSFKCIHCGHSWRI